MKPQRTEQLLFFLTFLVGILTQYPFLNYQNQLFLGDHGLNLYAIEAALNGQRPYLDFHWFYGPFMLYFYALFCLIFHTSVLTILHAIAFIKIATGLILFKALSLYFPPVLSLLGAAWFWIFGSEFPYTYNHIGGWPLSMLSFFYLSSYLKRHRTKDLYFALCSAFVLCFVKLNFGVSLLFGILLTTFGTDLLLARPADRDKKFFYLNALISFPILLALLHFYILRGVPFDNIRQCFQYFGSDAYRENYLTLIQTLVLSLKNHLYRISDHPPTLMFDILISSLFLTGAAPFLTGKQSKKSFLPSFLLLSTCFLFFLLSLHEYLLSGISFRRYWAEPFKTMLIFIILGNTVHSIGPKRRLKIYIPFVLYLSFAFLSKQQAVTTAKITEQFFPHKKVRVYTNNPPTWTMTVLRTTAFLEVHMKSDEKFFVVPYAPFYYFLTDKPSPTRQLAFFDYLKITEAEGRLTISDLEKENADWIVMTSCIASNAVGMGTFGETNSILIKKYIGENFELVAQFGEWDTPGGAIEPHGTRIYRRIKYSGPGLRRPPGRQKVSGDSGSHDLKKSFSQLGINSR